VEFTQYKRTVVNKYTDINVRVIISSKVFVANESIKEYY